VSTSIPILTYHSLDASGSVVSVAPTVFRRHMDVLHRQGLQGIALRTLLDAREGKAALPARPVVITFDDGYRNLLDHALPALRDRGFSATVFAIAGRCGADNGWPGQPASIPRLPLLSAADLRQVAAAGFEVGSHGLTHAALTRVSPEQAGREVHEAQARLQDLLGLPVRTFAYPYGLVDARCLALVRDAHQGACGTRLGWSVPADDPHALPRIDMYYFRHPWAWRLFPGALGRPYLRLRAVGRRCRAALLDRRPAGHQ
jgi:peptidoglycan/xylan/chitin deacetylase (PgdA/CDA1 family)